MSHPRNSRSANGTTGTQRRAAPRRPKPYSREEIEARRAAVPHIVYPENLPVSQRRSDIKDAIEHNQVVVIAGETGSGKTTQLPKICLELGRGITGLIGHTQPRRIAARSVAERICVELGIELGGAIGYQVRFTDHVGPLTLVKLMTDGILLAEIQNDPDLTRYDTIIIDEAHERSLNIDFLLGYLAQLLPRRPDLKVIITSATIDTERFARHFGQHRAGGHPGEECPVIKVSGRTYPVEILYRPLLEDTADSAPAKPATPGRAEAIDQVTGIIDACNELMAQGPGDILVFLSGEGEIRDTAAALRDELTSRYIEPGAESHVPQAVEVLPLFARLSSAEQHRIFESHRHRRIILATNIAETSLTVPGIRYVVDPGTARISRYSNKTKVQRLPIEPISQASANQRAGRCGRVQDGICIRLYSEQDFRNRDEFTQPEIQRTSLASVILQMVSLGLGDIAAFPFIDPPDPRAVRAGMQLLEEIGAVQPGHAHRVPRLTRIGRQLARLPIDPRLGRMLIEAEKNGCASEVMVVVAALSVQDVRERPAEKRPQADQLHARFTARTSDFLAYLTLWRYLHTQQRELSGSAFRRMCRTEFVNYLRYREWADVVTQLHQMARPLGLTVRPLALPTPQDIAAARKGVTPCGGSPDSAAVAAACRELGRSADTPEADSIHRSLLVGLLSNVGNWSERTHDYVGARGTHFVIWPGSGIRQTPAWVMAAELVETSRLFARTVAQIDPRWIEPLAAHLVKRSYSEPIWSVKNGAAMCKERVTLYGLTVVADRLILLSSIGTASARDLAHELFIRRALVEGQWRTNHAFVRHNEEALEEARITESKLRRRGLVADDDALAAFYAARIPETVTSARHFDAWWKKEKQHNPHRLDFTQEFLLGGQNASSQDFPAEWIQGDLALPLQYSFSPGAFDDGVTVTIPVTLLPQVQPHGFDWLVPGMREDLVAGTIHALPKRIRRQLVPAPDAARSIVPLLPSFSPQESDTVPANAPSFREAFTDAVERLRGFRIDSAAWDECTLPPHLRMRFRVRSERGAVLDEGFSLEALQQSLAPRVQKAVHNVVKGAVVQALDEAAAKLPTRTSETLTGWPTVADAIPASVETVGPHHMVVRGYPALLTAQSPQFGARPVHLGVVAAPAEQARDHRIGIIHLLAHAIALPETRITTRWSGAMALALAGGPYPNTSALVADLQLAAARNVADNWATGHVPLGELRDRAAWEDLLRWSRERHEDEVFSLAQLTAQICTERAATLHEVKAASSIALLATVSDITRQLDQLASAGFIATTAQDQLPHLPRYIQAARLRLTKAQSNPAADDALAWQVQNVAQQIARARADAATHAYDPVTARTLDQARWMLEEFRVSLFAQQLGTHGKVSAKRIEKLLATH